LTQQTSQTKSALSEIDSKLVSHKQVIESNVNRLDSLNTEMLLIKDVVKETSDLGLKRLGERDELIQSQLQRDKADTNKQLEKTTLEFNQKLCKETMTVQSCLLLIQPLLVVIIMSTQRL
jgi:hypothetical protein